MAALITATPALIVQAALKSAVRQFDAHAFYSTKWMLPHETKQKVPFHWSHDRFDEWGEHDLAPVDHAKEPCNFGKKEFDDFDLRVGERETPQVYQSLSNVEFVLKYEVWAYPCPKDTLRHLKKDTPA